MPTTYSLRLPVQSSSLDAGGTRAEALGWGDCGAQSRARAGFCTGLGFPGADGMLIRRRGGAEVGSGIGCLIFESQSVSRSRRLRAAYLVDGVASPAIAILTFEEQA